jgi:hypothetical protein
MKRKAYHAFDNVHTYKNEGWKGMMTVSYFKYKLHQHESMN